MISILRVHARSHHLGARGGEWQCNAIYSVNRAIRDDDHRIDQVAPTGVRLTDGVELARVRFPSKAADLYVTGIQSVPDAWAGYGAPDSMNSTSLAMTTYRT